MRNIAMLILFAWPSLLAASVENATVEQPSPGSYIISFQAAPDDFPVAIYASSKPDQFDAGTP